MTKRRGNPNYRLQPRDPATGRWIETPIRALEEPTTDHLIQGPVLSGDTARHALPVAGPVMLRLQGVGGPSALQTEAMYPVRVPVPVSLDEPLREDDELGIEPPAPIPTEDFLSVSKVDDPRPLAAVASHRQHRPSGLSPIAHILLILGLSTLASIAWFLIFRPF